MIPFAAVPQSFAPIERPLLEAIGRIVSSGAFIQGAEVRAFEAAFAAHCEAETAVAVSSGTDALILALRALGLRPGDEVITTPLTFFATAEAILLAGGVPVFADVDPATLLLAPEAVAAAVGPRTVGILPVHLYGAPADLAALGAIADDHGLWLLEDAAQAHGARLDGRRVGAIGRAGCFSFYPGKNLGTCGEGGAVVTNDAALADELRLLRDHGARAKYEHVRIGENARMSEIEAAALRLKLPFLDGWNARRGELAAEYGRGLAGLPVELQGSVPGSECVHHLFTLRCAERDELRAHLEENEIQCGLHYPRPLHLQPALGALAGRPGDHPVAEAAAARTLSLPMHPELTREQVRFVCATTWAFFARRKVSAAYEPVTA